MQDITIIGCGDIGRRVGLELVGQGKTVLAFGRSAEKLEKLEAEGFATLIGDLDCQEDTPEIPLHGSQVFYLAAPQGGGRSDYRMINFCRKLSAENCPANVVYISTSGV